MYKTYTRFSLLVAVVFFMFAPCDLTEVASRASSVLSSESGAVHTPAQDNKKSEKNRNADKGVRGYGPEILIPELGMKVIDVDYAIDSEIEVTRRMEFCASVGRNDPRRCGPQIKRLPRVIAVQERGPAYLAGITPGDVIAGYRRENWTNSALFARIVTQFFQENPARNLNIWLYYNVAGSQYPEKTLVLAIASDSERGGWITKAPVHNAKEDGGRGRLPGVADAKLAAKNDYQKLYQQTLAAIRNNPCAFSSGAERKAMETQLDRAAYSAGEPSPSGELSLIAGTGCNNLKDGELSDFEVAIWAMTYKPQIDPCSYSPTENYRLHFDETYRLKAFSKQRFYESTFRDFRMVFNGLPPPQKACVLSIFKSALIDREQKRSVR